MSLWCETAGQGPELVLLHGWGMNAGVWQPLLEALRERYRVTLIELPGHGESLLPQQHDLDAWTRACLQVAPERASWVGWSLGGLIAQRAALLAPQRIEMLCLVTATPSFVQREGWQAAMSPSVFQQFAEALVADPQATLKRFLSLQVKGAEDARVVLRGLNEALAQRPAADVQGLRAGLQLLLDGDLRGQLAQLAVPSRWLFGERDTLVPAAVAQALPELLAGARSEVIAGAGHAPLLSHPQQCLQWLEACCG